MTGLLNLNKPRGITSHDAVNRIRRIFHTKQVGHTGTLDPMAEGVLPILVGSAVKTAELFASDEKSYLVGLTLGITTDTEDITGNILTTSDLLPTFEQVESAVNSFMGDYDQIPPMYAAIKVGGKKLYEYARQGIEIEREARRIQIMECSVQKGESPRNYYISVRCSKGAYMRTLCADIGKKLGCGAVMSSLTRTAAGVCKIENSLTLEALEQSAANGTLSSHLLSPEDMFCDWPAVTLPAFYAKLAKNGAEIYIKKAALPDFPLGQYVRMYDEFNCFFALGLTGDYPQGKAVKVKKFL